MRTGSEVSFKQTSVVAPKASTAFNFLDFWKYHSATSYPFVLSQANIFDCGLTSSKKPSIK